MVQTKLKKLNVMRRKYLLRSKCLLWLLGAFPHSNDPIVDQRVYIAKGMYRPPEVPSVVNKRVS